MFVVVDGCDFGVVTVAETGLVLQLWFLLKTFSQISDKVIKQWFRIVVFVCSTLKCSMFDGGWTLFAQLLQSAFPFYCWNSNNLERLGFLCYDVSNIHILLCSELINEGYRFHGNVWFVSQPFFVRLRICVAKWILIVHNAFNCCSYTGWPQRVNCCLPSCWSAGSGFWKKSSVTYALKFYVQCV